MSWLQLRLDTVPGDVTTLEEALLAAGAVAVTLEDNADDPVLEPGVGETPLWRQTRLTVSLPIAPLNSAARARRTRRVFVPAR